MDDQKFFLTAAAIGGAIVEPDANLSKYKMCHFEESELRMISSSMNRERAEWRRI